MEPDDKAVPSSCMNDAEVSAFLSRQLGSSRFLECADHIAECEICRGKLANRENLDAAKSRLESELNPFVEHIPEDELQKYVSGQLGLARVREIEGHLAKCTQCVEEVRDLRNFVLEIHSPRTPFIPKRLLVFAAAAAMVVITVSILVRQPREVVALNDVSGRVSLDQRGALHGVGLLAADQQKIVTQSLAQEKLVFPGLSRELRGNPGALMGTAEPVTFRLEEPVATAVRSTRPTLSWTADSQSVGYRVTLKDQNTAQTITSPLLQTTSWTVSLALARGQVYAWQVASLRKRGAEVIAPAPPAPAAKFVVLDAVTNSNLERLSSSHLVRAALYANAGLLDDANRELARLREMNPQSSLVRNLLEQLQQAREHE